MAVLRLLTDPHGSCSETPKVTSSDSQKYLGRRKENSFETIQLRMEELIDVDRNNTADS